MADHWIHLRLPDEVPNGIGEHLTRNLQWADDVPEAKRERWEADLRGRLAVLVGMPIDDARTKAEAIVRQWYIDILEAS